MIFMNARHNLFTISLLAAILCFASTAGAQSPYERALEQNLWNLGLGVNGIRQRQDISLAQALVYGAYEQGDFRAPWEAESLWKAGARSEALRHLDKFSLSGSFGFEEWQGEGMCGPMSIEPGYFPIEAWEFSPGVKTLQTYVVDGAISVDISDNLRLGGRFLMDSRNYSKRKDLRHTNYRLDMECRGGLAWHSDEEERAVIELIGILGKTSETITAEQIGTAAGIYDAFLDKGLMYGAYELWNGSGVHLSESGVSGLPMRENVYGAALEASFSDALFASLQYRYKDGSAGEKEYMWFRFPAETVDLLLAARSGSHTFRLSVEGLRQQNWENVLDKISSGGISTVNSYGYNLIFQKRRLNLAPSYEYSTKLFTLRAFLDYSLEESLSSQMYPYLFEQDYSAFTAGLSLRYHRRAFEFELALSCFDGRLDESETKVAEVLGTSAPQRYAQGFSQLYEWLCASRGELRAELLWYPGLKNCFIGLGLDATHCFVPVSTLGGRDSFSGNILIGINF